MKKSILSTILAFLSTTMLFAQIPASQSAIPFGLYVIDINAINDINPNSNSIAIYNGINLTAPQPGCYVLSPVTVPTTYSNSNPPTVNSSKANFCVQYSGDCPNVCDINQLVTNSTNQSDEYRNQNYTTGSQGSLAGIINNYQKSNPTMFNCFVLNQKYLINMVANSKVSTVFVQIGLSPDGSTLEMAYFCLDASKTFIPGTFTVDCYPVAYFGAKVK